MEIHVINVQKIVLNVIALNVLHAQKVYTFSKTNVSKNAETDFTQKTIKFAFHVLNQTAKYVKTINAPFQSTHFISKMKMSFQNAKMDSTETIKQNTANHVLKDALYALLKLIV